MIAGDTEGGWSGAGDGSGNRCTSAGLWPGERRTAARTADRLRGRLDRAVRRRVCRREQLEVDVELRLDAQRHAGAGNGGERADGHDDGSAAQRPPAGHSRARHPAGAAGARSRPRGRPGHRGLSLGPRGPLHAADDRHDGGDEASDPASDLERRRHERLGVNRPIGWDEQRHEHHAVERFGRRRVPAAVRSPAGADPPRARPRALSERRSRGRAAAPARLRTRQRPPPPHGWPSCSRPGARPSRPGRARCRRCSAGAGRR